MANPKCPVCGGAGWLSLGIEKVTDPQFGKAIPCDACNRTDDISRLRTWSDLGDAARWRFETFPGSAKARKMARRAYELRQGLWVFYSTTFGTGKTGLLVAVVTQAWENNERALYQSVPGMLDYLRRSYQRKQFDEVMEELKTIPILALDEFHRWYNKAECEDPAEGSQSWASEKIFQLIDHRYMHYRDCLTLIATNRDITQGNDPVVSRFSDTLRSHIIPVDGGDLRPLAKQVEVNP